MNDTPNVFTSNSRYLPPPIRTANQSPHSYKHSDCQRAAAFLNQDWTPTSATPSKTSSEFSLSPPSAKLPPTRSDYSEDDSDDDCDTRSEADSHKCSSPDLPFSFQQRLPHVFPDRRDRRASHSMTDLLASRRLSGGTDSILVSRSLGNGFPSPDRGVRSNPYPVHHHQTKSLPIALHPSSSSSHSHPSSSGSRHSRNLSSNSHSTGSPPPTPSTPSSPALSSKNESPQSSSTASPPATVNTDDHIQRMSGGKSRCIWNDANGNECGFQSSSSLVKRHVRTVHLKIRYVVFCLSWTLLTCLTLSPVVCPECGQSFATKFHLKTHQNIQYVRLITF